MRAKKLIILGIAVLLSPLIWAFSQVLVLEPLGVLDIHVSLRKVELEAANLQDAARIAARRHDWNEVNDLVAQLDVLGVENEWVKESTKKLREYADRRETERFSKEAFYKSDRMRTRMGVRDESARYIPEAEAMKVPSFLRRKVEFGKKSQTTRRNPRS